MEKIRDFTTQSMKTSDALLEKTDQTEQHKIVISDDQYALCSFIDELNKALNHLRSDLIK